MIICVLGISCCYRENLSSKEASDGAHGRELPVTSDHLLQEYYSSLRRMEMLAYGTTTCMNLENTMLREMDMSQRESDLRCFPERQVLSLEVEEQQFFPQL